MNDLDKKIREALSAQDAELFEEFGGEQGLMEMVGDTFRGQRRWLVILVFIYSIVFFVLAIITAVQFFKADPDNTRDLIMWAMGFLFCNIAVAMLKMWYFMEMNKNAVTREVKRLELQIARLAKRLSE
ncbi:MAG: hypothetical protein IIB54_10785 [Planctomycetes bacterium]|nr:hypothetical protein [Planctomycetota bacterium]